MDNDDGDRSFFVIVVVALMAVILLFVPLLAWMYIDIKMMEIRVNKALAKIESKWSTCFYYYCWRAVAIPTGIIAKTLIISAPLNAKSLDVNLTKPAQNIL